MGPYFVLLDQDSVSHQTIGSKPRGAALSSPLQSQARTNVSSLTQAGDLLQVSLFVLLRFSNDQLKTMHIKKTAQHSPQFNSKKHSNTSRVISDQISDTP